MKKENKNLKLIKLAKKLSRKLSLEQTAKTGKIISKMWGGKPNSAQQRKNKNIQDGW